MSELASPSSTIYLCFIPVLDFIQAWIKSRTGIKQRYIVEDGEASSDISAKIAEELLEKSKIHSDEIDLIIVGTVTPDHYTPSTAVEGV